MNNDPRDIISHSPMRPLQWIIVGITILLNALDGFDVLSISFASPGIAAEWGLERAALGVVLSMELLGMCFGSIFLGGIADRIGRRPTMLGCLLVMSTGMFMATTAHSIAGLSVWRVITGLGIGGMLASINAVAAEFASTHRRHMCVSLMTIGYPLGAVIGGMAAAALLREHDWRSVFYFGATVTAACIPLVYLLIPESLFWLTQKQPAGALQKINAALARLGHSAIERLPRIDEVTRQRSFRDIFAPKLIATTLIVTTAYFFHITTFYFILKWVPKIVVDMGFQASTAAGVLVWMNLGGVIGGAVFGLLTLRYSVKTLSIVILACSSLMVTLFGQSGADLGHLSLICALAGFCTNGGIVGLYAIFAHAFPTHVRAFGTGFAIGVGRGGSVLAPMLAGFLFAGGYALSSVSMIMAIGSLLGAGVLFWLKLDPAHDHGVIEEDDPEAESTGVAP